MFRDVVSDALSKLDGNKSTELSPPGKVSGSIPVTSDCIMALVPVSQTISTATHNVAQNFYPQNEFSVNPGKQTIQSFPCLPLNSNANQAVHNAAQCSEKVGQAQKNVMTNSISAYLFYVIFMLIFYNFMTQYYDNHTHSFICCRPGHHLICKYLL